MTRRKRGERGTSLLEVLIASVVVVVLMLGLVGGLAASFLADAASASTTTGVNLARRTMEETTELPFGDVLALDGDTVLTTGGYAVRISVVQSGVDLALVEVSVRRPVPAKTLGELQGMTLGQFKELPAAHGSAVSLVTMKFKG